MGTLDNLIDHPLEGGSDIFQLEGHYFVAVNRAAIGEDRLVLIWWMYLDLIVSGIGIHKAEEFITRCCVNHLVYDE